MRLKDEHNRLKECSEPNSLHCYSVTLRADVIVYYQQYAKTWPSLLPFFTRVGTGLSNNISKLRF